MNYDIVRNWQYVTLNNNLKSGESLLRTAAPEALTTYRDTGTGWTALEVLCHLRDLEGIVLQRARMTVEQDNPPLPAPDADEMAAAGNYNAQAMETVLANWKARRVAYMDYMRERNADDWTRTGVHPKRGPLTLLDQFTFVAMHDSIHIEQMTRVLHEQRTSATI